MTRRSAIDGGCVLITGASSGIGKAIAELVAPRAKELVLVARRKDRLDELAQQLKDKHGVAVHTFSCDLSDMDAVYELLANVAGSAAPVDVLVNNAGLGDLGVFDHAEPKKLEFMIAVNVSAVVRLTRALLPGMIDRGRGAVLMIGSGFGLGYLPGFATYAATKYFVAGFTEALHTELAGTGVHACQVCPGPVATEFESNVGNFTGAKVPSFLQISAETAARVAVGAVDAKRALIVPHVFFKLLILIAQMTPRWMTRMVLRFVGKRFRAAQLAKTASDAG